MEKRENLTDFKFLFSSAFSPSLPLSFSTLNNASPSCPYQHTSLPLNLFLTLLFIDLITHVYSLHLRIIYIIILGRQKLSHYYCYYYYYKYEIYKILLIINRYR